MKLLLSLLVLATTPAALAQSQVLKAGETIQISCGSGPSSPSESVGSVYARLPYAHKIRILRAIGIGPCSMKTVNGNYDFFVSPRYPQGTYVTSQTVAVIDHSLRAGECD